MRFQFGFSAAYLAAVGMALAQTQNLPEPSPSNTLLPCEVGQGYQLLFSGTLASFDNNFANYQQNNNTNTNLSSWALNAADSSISGPSNSPDIRSQQTYGDFDLRLSYKNTGNDGIIIKTLTRGSSIWTVGVEVAIDNPGPLTPTTKTAVMANYDMFGAPAATISSVYKPYSTSATAWNSVRIVAKGDSVEHWLNNTLMVGYRFWNARWNTALPSSKWTASQDFAQNTAGCRCYVPTGFIGFQGDHAGVWYIRNLRITTSAANVNLGPAQCAVGIKPEDPERLGFSLEPVPGALRFILKGGVKAAKAEILGLDGKSGGLATIEQNGTAVTLRKWDRSGVGFLRVRTERGTVYRERIFLP